MFHCLSWMQIFLEVLNILSLGIFHPRWKGGRCFFGVFNACQFNFWSFFALMIFKYQLTQVVEKNYAFEIPDVPEKFEYLEVRYSVSQIKKMNGFGLKMAFSYFWVFSWLLIRNTGRALQTHSSLKWTYSHE